MIEMMYVYFDKAGNIKAITDSENSQFENFEVATFPLKEVKIFLDKNPSDPGSYTINKIKRLDGIKYTLVKKNKEVTLTRTLDGYLCKIPAATNKTMISIINNTDDKLIKISFKQEIIEKYNAGAEDNVDEIFDFLNLGPLDIYITSKNNPYNLLYSFKYIPRELFDKGVLYFNYISKLKNTSAYAKKASCGYGYRERS